MGGMMGVNYVVIQNIVIPAKAGIHRLPMKFIPLVMDHRLRGGDDSVDKGDFT
jgi:hypothetical protein